MVRLCRSCSYESSLDTSACPRCGADQWGVTAASAGCPSPMSPPSHAERTVSRAALRAEAASGLQLPGVVPMPSPGWGLEVTARQDPSSPAPADSLTRARSASEWDVSVAPGEQGSAGAGASGLPHFVLHAPQKDAGRDDVYRVAQRLLFAVAGLSTVTFILQIVVFSSVTVSGLFGAAVAIFAGAEVVKPHPKAPTVFMVFLFIASVVNALSLVGAVFGLIALGRYFGGAGLALYIHAMAVLAFNTFALIRGGLAFRGRTSPVNHPR